MPFRPWTIGWITIHLLAGTHFLLCCQYDHFTLISMCLQKITGILCNRSRDCFCRKIKYLISKIFSNGTDRRKQCGNRLARSGGCLNKQYFFAVDGSVYIPHQFALSIPVRKRKLQRLDRCLTDFSPCKLKIRPFPIRFDHILKPSLQPEKRKTFLKPPDFFCIQITVRHLHGNLIQTILQRINIGVAHRLRLVHKNRFLKTCHIRIHALDLINCHTFLTCDNAVSPAIQRQHILLLRHFQFQRNLCTIFNSHPSLNFAVHPAAFLHSLFLHTFSNSIVNISRTKNKFHQISHGNPYSRQLLLLSLIRILCLFHK